MSSRNNQQPKPLRVDVHTHILPESWPNLKQRYGYGGFIELKHTCAGKATMWKDDGTPFREVEDNLWSLNRRIQDCNAIDVDVHVLSTVPVMFSYWAKPEDTLDLSQILNDHIARCVNEYPQRFIGLGTVPMQNVDLAIQELTRCVKELGLRGVQIGTHINNWSLSEPQLYKFFQKAEELNASIFIHPWDMFGSELMKQYFLPWLVGMPAETSLAICSLMFSGVFERLPNLRICFAHGGGAFPSTIGRIQHGFNVRPDLCAKDTKLSPIDHLGKFWADSLVHDADALDMIVKVFGEDKICLGTDYPFPLGEYTAESLGTVYAAGELIDSMGIEDNQYENNHYCTNCQHDSHDNEHDKQRKKDEQNDTANIIPPSLPTENISSASPSVDTSSSSSATLPSTFPVPPKGIPYNPNAIPCWDYFTYTPHSHYQQYIHSTLQHGCTPSTSSLPISIHQQKLLYNVQQQSNQHHHCSVSGCCISSYLRPRYGWTHERRKKVLGSNAMEWLNVSYESFIRK